MRLIYPQQKGLKLNNLSYLSGIYVGIKIFLYASDFSICYILAFSIQ